MTAKELNTIGLIGAGVMGSALAMNIASRKLTISLYNRTYQKSVHCQMMAKSENLDIMVFKEIADFVASLRRPRKVIVIVSSGTATDAVVENLTKLLEPGDIVIDAANEFYRKTEERMKFVHGYGLLYLGMGVSGGESGARYGPSLMPGGDREAYDAMEPILQKIAAVNDVGVECVKYMGAGGAGHFVKMVHNGIEYGIMEAIAEIYDILRKAMKYDNKQISDMFKFFNSGRLDSYLCEITSYVLEATNPDDPNSYLVDDVLDVAGAKGTGMWTSQESFRLGVPCPTICAAVDARNASSCRSARRKLATKYNAICRSDIASQELTAEDFERALYACYVLAFTQGVELIRKASLEYNYDINLSDVFLVWERGCILRGRILKALGPVVTQDCILSSDYVVDVFRSSIPSLKGILKLCLESGTAAPALSSTANLLFALTDENCPMNLIQGLRDHFGAHTFFMKSDASKPLHANWVQSNWC
uniref:6-phosphogluconate dehydrogenase, decarboxylating n=1 Tax=Dermatophagoides pteronyssinus TaxID=6956 RepID=A0A6P6Y548_DERPT|nr:uncharacterized protein LOC113794481 [Dermatophagoides pteronyssinus]